MSGLMTSELEYNSTLVISIVQAYSSLLAKIGLTDLAVGTEDWLKELFNIMDPESKYINLNSIDSKFPGIDLLDLKTGRPIQVSVSVNGDKVKNSYDKLNKALTNGKKFPEALDYIKKKFPEFDSPFLRDWKENGSPNLKTIYFYDLSRHGVAKFPKDKLPNEFDNKHVLYSAVLQRHLKQIEDQDIKNKLNIFFEVTLESIFGELFSKSSRLEKKEFSAVIANARLAILKCRNKQPMIVADLVNDIYEIYNSINLLLEISLDKILCQNKEVQDQFIKVKGEIETFNQNLGQNWHSLKNKLDSIISEQINAPLKDHLNEARNAQAINVDYAYGESDQPCFHGFIIDIETINYAHDRLEKLLTTLLLVDTSSVKELKISLLEEILKTVQSIEYSLYTDDEDSQLLLGDLRTDVVYENTENLTDVEINYLDYEYRTYLENEPIRFFSCLNLADTFKPPFKCFSCIPNNCEVHKQFEKLQEDISALKTE